MKKPIVEIKRGRGRPKKLRAPGELEALREARLQRRRARREAEKVASAIAIAAAPQPDPPIMPEGRIRSTDEWALESLSNPAVPWEYKVKIFAAIKAAEGRGARPVARMPAVPVPPKAPVLGKKDATAEEARQIMERAAAAGEGDDDGWGSDLDPHSGMH